MKSYCVIAMNARTAVERLSTLKEGTSGHGRQKDEEKI